MTKTLDQILNPQYNSSIKEKKGEMKMLKAMLNLINQQKQKSKKGFTLVELIVVIAILGILAALVVPSVSGYIKKAQDATNEANAQMLYSAAQLYVIDKEVGGSAVSGTITAKQLFDEGYIQKEFKDTAKLTISVTAASDSKKAYVTLDYTPSSGSKTQIILGGPAGEKEDDGTK